MDERHDFQTTAWSAILSLREADESEYRAKMDVLIQRYWRPVWAYLRRRVRDEALAEDLTQEFFTNVLAREGLREVRREGGTFRGYLRRAAENFLVQAHRRESAQRRRPREGVIRFGDSRLEQSIPDQGSTPEEAFDREWARQVLAQVLERMRTEYEEHGRTTAFLVFRRLVVDRALGAPPAGREEVAGEHDLTITQVDNYIRRGKASFQRYLREAILDTVSSVEDVDREIAELRSHLGGT